ncbi:hypothetical protein C8J57DRAFT_1553773 [Mycena rebaudengoi]|nr:hypothetical protein C8J57DRAFT_1553773 [Mycena rebaudengoi]
MLTSLRLLGMREFQREAILTARFDQLAMIHDREHVCKLHAQQLAGVCDTFEEDVVECTLPPRPAQVDPHTAGSSQLAGMVAVEDDTLEEDAVKHTPPPRPAQVDPHATGSSKVAIRQRPSATPKEEPLTNRDLLRMILTRDKLELYSSSPWFKKIVTGGWVRYLIRSDRDQSRAYRIYQIKAQVLEIVIINLSYTWR